MANYVNKNCPRCGGYVQILTGSEVCEKCGYMLEPQYATSTTSTSDENKICPICKKPLIKQVDGGFKCDDCSYIEKTPPATPYTHEEIRKIFAELDNKVIADCSNTGNAPGLYGWICPKCGSVMSPYTEFCPNCTHHNLEITYSTTSTGPTHIYENKQSTFDANKFIGGRKDKLGYE